MNSRRVAHLLRELADEIDGGADKSRRKTRRKGKARELTDLDIQAARNKLRRLGIAV